MNVRCLRLAALLALTPAVGASLMLLGCDFGAHSTLDETNATAGSNTSAGNASSGAPAGGGTTNSSAGSSTADSGTAGTSATPSDSLAKKYADFFPIGAAIGDFQLNFLDELLAQDFNHLTCENAMKAEDIHPTEASYTWTEADRIADFARQHGMKMTGHALLWHQRTPAWMLAGASARDAASLEVVKTRLKAHIEAVIGRYADVVDNWDVVNEALSDDPAKQYRDGAENSQWFQTFGSQEYIYWAYKFAKDALEAKSPGSSAGKLYYNEYVATTKADKILKLLAWLKNEKGIQIDGVGFQSHEDMIWPSVADLQIAMADSRGRCNGMTLYGQLEGEADVADETRVEYRAKSRAVAAMEGRPLAQRHWTRVGEAPGVGSLLFSDLRRHCASRAAEKRAGADRTRARRDFEAALRRQLTAPHREASQARSLHDFARN